MNPTVDSRAARHARVGRLVSFALVAAGVAAVGGSAMVEERVRPDWFWTDDDLRAVSDRVAHFDKLYRAYVLENQRRARSGRPPLSDHPEALRRAEEAIEEAGVPLEVAKQRPRQIADGLRLGGATLCVAGIAVGLATRSATGPTGRRRPAASASDGAAGQ